MVKGLLSLLIRSLEYRIASSSPKLLLPIAFPGGGVGGSQLAQNILWWYLGSSKAGFWFSADQDVPTTRSVGWGGCHWLLNTRFGYIFILMEVNLQETLRSWRITHPSPGIVPQFQVGGGLYLRRSQLGPGRLTFSSSL